MGSLTAAQWGQVPLRRCPARGAGGPGTWAYPHDEGEGSVPGPGPGSQVRQPGGRRALCTPGAQE